MPQFANTRRVHHAAADIFDLVADVEKYPEFVPLCKALKVKSRIPKGEGVEILVADMTVAYKLIQETFSSRVTLDKPKLQIKVEYLNGPFQKLDNNWSFRDVGQGMCDVDFFISYEFKNRVLAALMGAMFDAAFRRFSVAFEQRANQVYGNKNGDQKS